MQRTCWICSDARICVTAVDMLIWDCLAGVSFRVCPCLRIVSALDIAAAKSLCCLDVRRTCFFQLPIATERSFHCCKASTQPLSFLYKDQAGRCVTERDATRTMHVIAFRCSSSTSITDLNPIVDLQLWPDHLDEFLRNGRLQLEIHEVLHALIDGLARRCEALDLCSVYLPVT